MRLFGWTIGRSATANPGRPFGRRSFLMGGAGAGVLLATRPAGPPVDLTWFPESEGARHAGVKQRSRRTPGQHRASVHLFPNGIHGNDGVVDFEMLTSVVLQRGKEFVLVPITPAVPAASIASLAARARHDIVTVELNGTKLFDVRMAGTDVEPAKRQARGSPSGRVVYNDALSNAILRTL